MIDKQLEPQAIVSSEGRHSTDTAQKATGGEAKNSRTPASATTRRRLFDELPGTSEGKAALLDFELGQLDFVETPGGEIVEEQVCFDFGEEFEAQSEAVQVGFLSKDSGLLEAAGAQAIAAPPQTDTDEQEVTVPTAVISEDAEWAGDDHAQLAFSDAEEKASAMMMESPAAVAAEASADSARKTGQAQKQKSSAAEGGGADEIEMRGSKMVLDESALPSLQVGTDDELMQSIDSIPDKMAFKIGEVADMVGVKQYVLRYWESEFDALRPRKSRNGQRVYTRRDVETALMIKKLLYTDRFSIEGARAALKQLKSRVREEKEWNRLIASHEKIGAGLRGLLGEIRRAKEALV